ncbi:hypothetical protein ACM26M_02830 [Kluyvera cryocrescens]|uniref:hypothetical protein n=1 Tax=Kluyvera cryocrescens TaxID=580 RepID=UPI0039F6C2AB
MTGMQYTLQEISIIKIASLASSPYGASQRQIEALISGIVLAGKHELAQALTILANTTLEHSKGSE